MHILAGLLAALAVFVGGYKNLAASMASFVADPQPQQQATVLFGGDMMFDRTVRTAMKWRGGDFIFSCIDPLLQAQDLVVANLEGPITPHASVSASSTPGDPFNMTFTFPLSTADLLYRYNIRIVNLGNNHIENFGIGGVRSTVAALDAAHVDYFGVPSEALACPSVALCEGGAKEGDPISRRVASANIDGIPLAFINYNEFAGDPARNAVTTISQIKAARFAGFLPIVYTHWGIEYATISPQYIRDLAHRFVDAGAEIVIGSHPHVVEDHELYNGKYIYYSLGNFIFDQYFSDEVRHGLLLQIVFTSAGTRSIKEIPIVLNRDRTTCAQ